MKQLDESAISIKCDSVAKVIDNLSLPGKYYLDKLNTNITEVELVWSLHMVLKLFEWLERNLFHIVGADRTVMCGQLINSIFYMFIFE